MEYNNGSSRTKVEKALDANFNRYKGYLKMKIQKRLLKENLIL